LTKFLVRRRSGFPYLLILRFFDAVSFDPSERWAGTPFSHESERGSCRDKNGERDPPHNQKTGNGKTDEGLEL